MNPQKSPEITVETLLALRKDEDAVRLITERLRVKEMGPADHIRTKHEVKAFVETGEARLAADLLKRTNERLTAGVRMASTISQRQGQKMAN